MGIFDKFKESLKKRKEAKIARQIAEEEAMREIENFAVELNKEVLDIYANINEIDVEKRKELANRAGVCIDKYLKKIDRVRVEIKIAEEVYDSYKNDDDIIAHLSDYEMERELNDLMTEVQKKVISAKQLNAAFKAAVGIKAVLEGEQNFVSDNDIKAVMSGKKSYGEIVREARFQAEKYHDVYSNNEDPVFNSDMLSFIGKVASAITMSQGIAERNVAKTVAGAALYRANSKITENEENKQQGSQRGE